MKPLLLSLSLALLLPLSGQTPAGTPTPAAPTPPAPTEPSPAKVVDLRCEFQTNPQAVNNPLPRFSWRIETEEPGIMQASYHLLVASNPELLSQDRGDLWDSGEVSISRSQYIDFEGIPFDTAQKFHWKVRIKDRSGRSSAWSPQAHATIQLAGPTNSDSPLGPSSRAPRSTFECNDPNLNSLFAEAVKSTNTLNGMRDLGLGMRALLLQSELSPSTALWLKSAHNSVDDAGFYPAELPPTGSFGSCRSDAVISCTHAYWWATGDSEILTRYWSSMYAYTTKRRKLDPKLEGRPFGELPSDTLPEGDPTPPSLVHLITQALNVRLLLEMAPFASLSPYETKVLLNYQQDLSKSFAAQHLDAKGTLKYRSLTGVLMALRSGLLVTEESKATNKYLLLEILDELDKNPFGESPFAAANLLPVLTWLEETPRASKLASKQRAADLTPLAKAAISEWLITMIAGIDAAKAGYSTFHLRPRINNESLIQSAGAEFHAPNGPIRASYHWNEGTLCYDLSVPPNSIAIVLLPCAEGQVLREADKDVSEQKFVFGVKREKSMIEFRAAPGNYMFTISGK